MPYTIPNGSKIRVQVVGRLHGQRTRTTFSYLYTGAATAPDGVAALTAMLTDFEDQIGVELKNVSSSEWDHEYTSAQVISPTRYRMVVQPINLQGAIAGNALPSAVAAVIKRTTDRAGRRYQGRIYLPGVPATYEDDSEIAVIKRPLYDTLAANMVTPLEGVDPGEDFTPVVSLEGAMIPAADTVRDAVLDPVLRYQRRREVGVGE